MVKHDIPNRPYVVQSIDKLPVASGDPVLLG
jgi:hypothetical protein